MTAQQAAKLCHVRGYISQDSNPEIKLWKNSFGFYQSVNVGLPGIDWNHYDPEGEETSIVG